MEIGWTCSMFWEASALACKVTAFFRALCFYLSGFVIMVISIDRLLAVIHPLQHRFNFRLYLPNIYLILSNLQE